MEYDTRNISQSLTYKGKSVVVTGCASGMGRATARMLTELGAEVHGLDFQDCEPGLTSFRRFDLRDPASIDAVAQAIGSSVKSIDALFNCAGLPTTFPAMDVMKVNYIGTRYLTEQLLPFMTRGSAIGSISSSGGGIAWAKHLPTLLELLAIEDYDLATAWAEAHPEDVKEGYSLAKEAVIVWTMQKAAELIERGIRINCTLPGATQTPMMVDHFERQSPRAVSAFARPIMRRSSPEEQARPLIFLNSDAASYINGVALPVDGGFLAGLAIGQFTLAELLAPNT